MKLLSHNERLPEQIKTSAKAIANQLVALQPTTDQTLWTESAYVFSALIDYSVQTQDHTHDALVAREIASQAGAGPPYFEPTTIQSNLTNAGQAQWALTALQAAEVQFLSDAALPLSYAILAEKVFEQLTTRWDQATCAGGLNSTISQTSAPTTKDVIAAAELFQLGSRLALSTGDGSYTAWANRIFDWISGVGLLSSDWNVYANADPSSNCTEIDRTRWSISAGEMLYGSALMYNLVSVFLPTNKGRAKADECACHRLTRSHGSRA